MRRIEVELSPDERRELEHIVKYERDARMVKRAQALLWLNEGEKITVITHRLQVRRQTVYNRPDLRAHHGQSEEEGVIMVC